MLIVLFVYIFRWWRFLLIRERAFGASDHPIENIKTIEVYDGNLRAWIVRNIDSNYGYYPPSDPTSDFYSMRHLHDACFSG